ncbi:HzsA-related protein [Luteimonas sp. A611]
MSKRFPSSHRNGIRIGLALAASTLLAGCGVQVPQDDSDPLAKTASSATTQVAAPVARSTASAAAKAATVQNPILFVTQVPISGNGSSDPFASRMSTFANHLPDINAVPRGGDLMIRYPDGTLRNLTREGGYGMDGLQGANAIAVREPTVHWSGNKAVFSMVVGAPPRQHVNTNARWQLYEVTGLARGQTARITKVANQSAYNNVSPLYASDDRILFTSDRPRGGEAHLYPQLDEYESTPTITGIYSLEPASGALRILNHTPSGAFSPSIDSYGRVIFTRWDHLQRDQQGLDVFGAVNFASEAANAAKLSGRAESFPETLEGMATANYGRINAFTYNLFTPWQINQDGTDELTLNHIGRHELSFNYILRSFAADNALIDTVGTTLRANRTEIDIDSGLFHLREDPRAPGTLYGIHANEFAEGSSGRIMRVSGAPNLAANQMTITVASASGGRYRNPLPTSNGAVVASHTPSSAFSSGIELRLRTLDSNASGLLTPGTALTSGISKTVSWWTPGSQASYSGPLWEVDPAEVVARTPPPSPTLTLTAPERAVLAEEQVDETSLRLWLRAQGLALIVVRNQTSRDQADRQQPYNLQVPGGAKTVNGNGRLYDISHFQVFQGNQVRAYDSFKQGRRVLAQPAALRGNPANASGPAGSVTIARDGSSAAFVPASRALTWQTTDAAGEAIVRERVWVTLQPGEIRTCSGCHGENARNQAGSAPSQAKPEALRELMRHWKQTQSGNIPARRNGSAPLTRGG